MPSCVNCAKSQSLLNAGDLCRKCFAEQHDGVVKLKEGHFEDNTSLSDDNINAIKEKFDKPITECSVQDFITIIQDVINNTVVKDMSDIKREVTEINTQLKKVEVLEKDVQELKDTLSIQQKTIKHQQSFIEFLANKDRRNNLIITGVPEAERDEEAVTDIFEIVVPEIRENLEYEFKRLGDPAKARLPRPILLELLNDSKMKKDVILKNTKKLKENDQNSNIFVKKDTHPVFRKEHSRLYKLVSDESKLPVNQGSSIIYNRKGVITKDGMIIDRYQPHF